MRNAIVLASVLLLALLVWLGIARRSAEVSETGPDSTARESAPSSSEIVAEARAESAPVPARVEEAAADAERAQLAAESQVASGEELWVVSAATKAPLAGVRVSCLELDIAQRFRWFTRPYDLAGIRHVESEGVACTSDERGLARIEAPRERVLVLARTDELFGMLWIEPETPRPWTLALAADGAWTARATDALGKPIEGIWIGLHGDARCELTRVRTDAEGYARFEHARYALGQCERDEFELVPRAILAASVRAVWSGRVPPTEPTELRLPQLGLAEVALLDPAGDAWTWWDENVWLRDAHGAQAGGLQQSAGLSRHGEDGMRVHAQLGLELQAGLSSMAAEEPITVFGEHPVRADRVLRIELILGSTHPIARMRLIGPDGEPLPNEPVEVRRQNEQGHQHSTSISPMSTDARAQLLVPLNAPREGFRRLLTLALREDEEMQAVLEVPEEPKRGWIECGDVQLVQAPVLAAGRVVDATGAAVAGAKVELQAATMRMFLGKPARDAAAPESKPRTKDAWNFAAGRRWNVVSGADGAFALRSFERPERVRAAAKSGSAFMAHANWIEGECGRSDYVLIVPAATAVEGRVLLPEAVSADELHLMLKQVGRSGTGPRLAVDGSWSASGLEFGTWTAEVRASGAGEALAAAQFESKADETVRAPDLDLRDVRVLRVEVVDERGESLDATGSYAAPGSERPNDIYVRYGRARIITAHERLDASFEAPHRLRARIEDLQDGARIVLARGLPIRVRLRDASVLPSRPHVLVAWLSGGGGESAFDVAGEALVLAAQAGEQRVHLGLRRPVGLWDEDGGASLMRGKGPLSFAVSISESGETPELVIEVEAELVAEAVRELESR